MTAPITLTAKQVEYLRACAEGPTKARSARFSDRAQLAYRGLIVLVEDDSDVAMYVITDAGREWLAQEGK